MDVCTASPAPRLHQTTHYIEIVEPTPEESPSQNVSEKNLTSGNYRLLNETYCASFTPEYSVSNKSKLMPRFDDSSTLSPPRMKLLELLRPEDPGHDTLEAIMRPAPRRGLTRPLDEDTRRFLERALQPPGPYGFSKLATVEPHNTVKKSSPTTQNSDSERSLADELREAEEDEFDGGHIRRELLREFRRREEGFRDAVERERLGKLALSVEDDEGDEESGLSAATRRIDALLAESRDLHEELAGIHEDLQVLARRVARRDP